MKKHQILFLLIVGIIYSGCAPRHIERRQTPSSQNKIVKKSFEIIQKVERKNRDFKLRKLLI